MDEYEKEAIKVLKDETEYPPTIYDKDVAITAILKLVEKQEKQIKSLKEEVMFFKKIYAQTEEFRGMIGGKK